MSRIVALYLPTPQSGKSTVAKVFHDRGWVIAPFAKPIKSMLETLLFQLAYGVNDKQG